MTQDNVKAPIEENEIDFSLPCRELWRIAMRQHREHMEKQNMSKNINPYAVDEKMNKTEILEHMKEKLADRGKDYGDVTENHARQIDMINPYLSKVLGVPVNLTPSQMATLMVLVKIGRLIENKDHLDTWADIIGYAACGYEMISKGDGKPTLNANDDNADVIANMNKSREWRDTSPDHFTPCECPLRKSECDGDCNEAFNTVNPHYANDR